LWKFVKKQSLYSKYYADFAAFKTAITDCLSQTHTTHKEALDSLLTLRFQTFEKAQPMTVWSIAQQIYALAGQSAIDYTVCQAAYDLEKFRAKNLVTKVARSRRYTVPVTALRAMMASLVLRDKVSRSALANLGKPVAKLKPGEPSDLDEHHLRMQGGPAQPVSGRRHCRLNSDNLSHLWL
jgi:hypothetical protein